jgi:hypothetical protein
MILAFTRALPPAALARIRPFRDTAVTRDESLKPCPAVTSLNAQVGEAQI